MKKVLIIIGFLIFLFVLVRPVLGNWGRVKLVSEQEYGSLVFSVYYDEVGKVDCYVIERDAIHVGAPIAIDCIKLEK